MEEAEHNHNSDFEKNVLINEWQRIVELLAGIMQVRSAIITRVDAPEIEVYKASNNPGNPYSAGMRVTMNGHYCQEVIERNKMLHVADARQDPRWQSAPEIRYEMYSYLGYPVSWPDGSTFGTICVLDDKENNYSEEYKLLLAEFRNILETHLRMVEQNQLLSAQLDEIKQLRSILPICANCKQIRDEAGYWQQVENYISSHYLADFSHSICPACLDKLYPEFAADEDTTVDESQLSDA